MPLKASTPVGYTHTVNSDGSGGVFTDNVSKVQFPYVGGKRGPADKTRAKIEWRKHDAEMRTAAKSRPPAEIPTIRGIRVNPAEAQVVQPRQAKLDSVVHRDQPSGSVDTINSSIDSLIAHYQRDYDSAHNSADRNRALKRLTAAQTARDRALANQTKRDTKAA